MRAPPIAFKDRLWSRKDCARYLGHTRRAMERVEKRPGYPQARRPGGGHPRWFAAEVIAWAKGCVDKWSSEKNSQSVDVPAFSSEQMYEVFSNIEKSTENRE